MPSGLLGQIPRGINSPVPSHATRGHFPADVAALVPASQYSLSEPLPSYCGEDTRCLPAITNCHPLSQDRISLQFLLMRVGAVSNALSSPGAARCHTALLKRKIQKKRKREKKNPTPSSPQTVGSNIKLHIISRVVKET